ncbi:MAG: hypothetical protein LBC60_05040, partial [Spirochaetaceae bacterium]|nr:hypothetical protein [Spirochaetaceae bacterium]
IPSFEYELVELNRYRVEDLVRYGDALSFILLVDRIQNREELKVLKDLPQEYLEKITLKIPEGMSKLIRDVITVLLERLEVPPEEIVAVTEYVEKREDRTMFDGFVAAVLEDRQLAREEERAEAYREKLESARMLKEDGVPVEVIARSLKLSVEELLSLKVSGFGENAGK